MMTLAGSLTASVILNRVLALGLVNLIVLGLFVTDFGTRVRSGAGVRAAAAPARHHQKAPSDSAYFSHFENLRLKNDRLGYCDCAVHTYCGRYIGRHCY